MNALLGYQIHVKVSTLDYLTAFLYACQRWAALWKHPWRVATAHAIVGWSPWKSKKMFMGIMSLPAKLLLALGSYGLLFIQKMQICLVQSLAQTDLCCMIFTKLGEMLSVVSGPSLIINQIASGTSELWSIIVTV